jgi:hypothetical protein
VGATACAPVTQVQAAHVVDGVGLVRRLVRPVAHDPGEAQRHAAGVARRGLHAVDGDLDDELGAHDDRPAVGRHLPREQLGRSATPAARRSAP